MGVVYRQALLLASLGISFISYIVVLGRRGRLSFRFFVAWIIVGSVTALGGGFLALTLPIATSLSLSPTAIALTLGLTIALISAVEISTLTILQQNKIRKLGQATALQSQSLLQFERSQLDSEHLVLGANARANSEILVVVPALNEEDSISKVVTDVLALGYRCLVFDDGSTDSTATLASKAGANVIRAPFNLGIGSALQCCFQWAVNNGFEVVVQCDADGQHDPQLIRSLVDEFYASAAHLVIGSRFRNSDSYQVGLPRRLLMRIMARHSSNLAGVRITDSTSGFRCISGELLKEFAQNYPSEYMDSYEALVVSARAGYRVREVATEMNQRQGGTASHRPLRAAAFTLRVLLGGISGTRFQIKSFRDAKSKRAHLAKNMPSNKNSENVNNDRS